MRNNVTSKKKKGKKRIVAVVVILLLLVAAAGFVLLRGKRAVESPSLTTEKAFTGTISVVTEGSGSIEAASTKAVTLEYDGKLDTIYVEAGDHVSVGDEMAVYDTDTLDAVIEQKEAELDEINSQIGSLDDSGSSVITAPVSGRVKRIYAAEGDVVSDVVELNGGLLEISADSKLKVEFTCSDTSLSEGDSVTVEFDTWSVTGTIEEIEDGKIRVTIADDTSYMVDTEATVRGKSGAVLGTGKLLSNHPYLVIADYGIISSVEVTRESNVSAGDTLFERTDAQYNQAYLDLLTDREELVDDLRELREYQKNPVVVSEYDGYIVTLDVLEGMPYEKDQQFCTVADEATLDLKVEIDELDIDGVEAGQNAEVVFDAFEDVTYEGTVKKISGIGQNTGGVTTYTVTVELEGDEHIKNAMSATATITLETKDNVLLIPVDAVETLDGQKYVDVVKNGETIQTAITVGLMNEDYAEVTEGLSSGDEVVVNKQKSKDLFSTMMEQQQSMIDEMRE